MRGLEFAIDTDMIAAEGAYTNDSNAYGGGSHGLFFGTGRSDGRIDGLATTNIEVEDLSDLVLGLGAGSRSEAGCGGDRFVAEVGVSGDELEEIESDVFRAASGVEGSVHGIAFQERLPR